MLALEELKTIEAGVETLSQNLDCLHDHADAHDALIPGTPDYDIAEYACGRYKTEALKLIRELETALEDWTI